jgi:hypothetical protein
MIKKKIFWIVLIVNIILSVFAVFLKSESTIGALIMSFLFLLEATFETKIFSPYKSWCRAKNKMKKYRIVCYTISVGLFVLGVYKLIEML